MATPPAEAPDRRPVSEGGWIGIDLGTSNCAAAVWDPSRSRCKVLRLGYHDLARPPTGGGVKGGKIVPSAVLFRDSAGAGSELVGYAAIKNTSGDERVDNQRRSRALVTSFKRVVGMTSRQARDMKASDSDFWNSLPFQPVIMDADREEEERKQQHPEAERGDESLDVLGSTSVGPEDTNKSLAAVEEGVAISIQPLDSAREPPNKSSSERLVTPLQVTTILLKSIRAAATEYLTHSRGHKIEAPGLGDVSQANNCIIGVPAHYSHAQRTAIQAAAKKAGFRYAGVMTESTAAAMAYGLFVTPNTSSKSTADSPINGGKNILAFDMGGGTTDVTIACIDFGADGKVQFSVLATAGDQCLGGDNVDELLARHLLKRHATTSIGPDWRASEHQEFILQCRRAKEELCGNAEDDSDNPSRMAETHLALDSKTIRITREEFNSAIQPLIQRAARVVDDALSALKSHHQSSVIHEVVLVGGSTHIPTVRSMLRRKFPPPIPPDLCTSISAETAVAQGLAIQAALVSGTVPLWELRNAMMLDAVPHSIGVWVDPMGSDGNAGAPFDKGDIIEPDKDGKHRGHFVPILNKDSPLPAMASATFTLAATDQSGITVVAAEHIGPGEVYQCMGVFNFLLHRLDKESIDEITRNVEIGMTLETSGKFVVSVFDENDPEHREKRRRWRKQKAQDGGANADGEVEDEMNRFYEEEEDRQACSGTEIGLALFCIVFFALYVAARIAFSDIESTFDANDEL